MQGKVVETRPLPRVEVGRESEDMCLLARFFSGFANSTRLSILLLLARQGETKVGDLVRELRAPQPRVSDHLRCLAWCGYVEVRREMLRLGEAMLRDNFGHVESCEVLEKGC